MRKDSDTEAVIAVIGISCTLPGVNNIDQYWQLLRDGKSAITSGSQQRWDPDDLLDISAHQRAALGYGGFIDDVEGFDADFFGISPREARAMDPQQRLMLELTWSALEDAQILPGFLARTSTGVFVGSMRDDYVTISIPTSPTAHTTTGTHRGTIAGRISHTFGFHGPSMVIDTGQSSSLAAVHLAVESLRREESSLAIAAGIHLNLSSHAAASVARLGVLSPDGRCRAFDSAANGYVRGEGGGVVILERLSDAMAADRPIHCLVLGTAVNNCAGARTLTTPNPEAQEQLLLQAYENAGIERDDIQYIELHGTGTPQGDVAEARALADVFARTATRVQIGSVKTNIGHLEGAAGIAGLIKTAMALRHRMIPPSLNFMQPPAEASAFADVLRIQTELAQWPHPDRPLIAGVSSFGMSGSGAHAVVREPPAHARRSQADPGCSPVSLWPICARSDEALAAQATRLQRYIADHPDVDPADIAHSLATTRTQFPHRAAVATAGSDIAANRDTLSQALEALETGQPHGALAVSTADSHARTVFVFPGQGSQRPLMGLELAAAFPVFARALDDCDAALQPHTGWSLLDVLGQKTSALPLDRVDVVQPMLWGVAIALARLFTHYGITPDVVIGQSQGEVAAAHIAGALTLHDAARVIALRSRILLQLAGTGAMAAINAPVSEVDSLLKRWPSLLTVAVDNGAATTVSGDTDAIDELVGYCTDKQIRASRVQVDYASHSPHIEQIRDTLLHTLTGIRPQPATVPFYSTVDHYPRGIALDTTCLDADYWYDNLRNKVCFHHTLQALAAEDPHHFLEISPHPILTPVIADGFPSSAAIAALRKNQHEPSSFAATLAHLYCRGTTPDWTAINPAGRAIPIPTYAFRHRRYWVTAPPAGHRAPTDAPITTRVPKPKQPYSTPIAIGQPVDSDDILRLVRFHTAIVAGHTNLESVDVNRTFEELGFDSAMGMELSQCLARAIHCPLASTLIFDCPTPIHLAAHLRAMIGGDQQNPASTIAVPCQTGPIAVIGMSCRFPGGVDSAEDLWRVVAGGIDAMGEFPADRGWNLGELFDDDPDAAGKTYTRHGAFLTDAAGFDAGFFGISPREAMSMDPQQRVLLEVGWEALETAGINPQDLRETPTGVFTGTWAQPYGASDTEGYTITGTATSVTSGRIAYTLGLQGPAITIDTGCSSSLVAIHLACQSLCHSESSLALAGGVTIMTRPTLFTEFARQRGLAPDGRCKAFAAAADGTGWGEGAGMIVLERLSDAHRAGHRVLAVIAGSAVNQDGASNGLTAPNGAAQQRVITQALNNAGLTPADIDVVEAHGTGTTLGDPIEAAALHATYGTHHTPDQPLYLGSVKSNIGHTQAAAGVAGVIKMIKAINHALLPKTLHIDAPTPHVDWSTGAIELLTSNQPWPDTDHPRSAAVSSFGISGTNAHLILQQPPTPPPQQPTPAELPPSTSGSTGPLLYPVSAASPKALMAQAKRLRCWLLDHPTLRPADVAYSLAITRAQLPVRAALCATSRDELLDGLLATAAGTHSTGTHSTKVQYGSATRSGKLVMIFPGQGGQYSGMGVELYGCVPYFRDQVDRCANALYPHTNWWLPDILHGEPGAPTLDRVDIVQPALWAMTVALARLWIHDGITPDAVVGHSQGEIAAATVAEALQLDDAARIIAVRSQTIGQLSGNCSSGGMASVWDSARHVGHALQPWNGRLRIAAINAPENIVISGDSDALEAFLRWCQSRDIRTRRVPVDYASHSPAVDHLHGVLRDRLTCLDPRESVISFYSTVDGHPHDQPFDTRQLTADYWFANLRRMVCFEKTVRGLMAAGYSTFLEVSPHPTLTPALEQTICPTEHDNRLVVGSLHRDRSEHIEFTTTLAALHAYGHTPKWDAVLHPARVVDLPTYPFQHDNYWISPSLAPPTEADSQETQFWNAVDTQDPAAIAALVPGEKSAWEQLLPPLTRWHRELRVRHTCDRWRYRPVWSPGKVPSGGAVGGWMLIVPIGPAAFCAENLSQALERAGGSVHHLDVDLPDRAELAVRIRAYSNLPLAGIVSLFPFDERPHPLHSTLNRGLAGELLLAQAVADLGTAIPVWVVTAGAISTSDQPLARPVQTQTWGLSRVLNLENPQQTGGVIDIPVEPSTADWQQVVEILTSGTNEDHLAVRDGRVLRERLAPVAFERAPNAPLWQPEETVLIIGATGRLGPALARWLARNGANHLVLASRSAATDASSVQLRQELESLGVQVTVTSCDVTDRVALRELFDQLAAQGTPLRTAFHTAMSRGLDLINDLTPERMAATMEAKVCGALSLGELLIEGHFAHLVFFSSIMAYCSLPGHGSYAAANSFLDAYAVWLRSRGHHAVSISWGGWQGIDARGFGLPPMDPDVAFTALQQCMSSTDTHTVVADVDWDTYASGLSVTGGTPLIEALVSGSDSPLDRSNTHQSRTLAARLADCVSQTERDSLITKAIEDSVAAVSGLPATKVVFEQPFKSIGFDSLTAVALRNRLSAATGLPLPAALVYDFPTPADVREYVTARLCPPLLPDDPIAALERLESSLKTYSPDTPAETTVIDRLRGLLSRLSAANEPCAHDPDDVITWIDSELRQARQIDP